METRGDRCMCIRRSTYQEGQLWYDGCNNVCQCGNSNKYIYSYRQIFAMHATIPQGCVLVPDPKDPSYCWIPSCLISPKQTIGIVVAPEPTGTATGVRSEPSVGTGTASNKAAVLNLNNTDFHGSVCNF
ncbi:uncharacterized protein LOC123553755 [Mercenaria mercenaria]|uniref:uncharacterized protein LOC123553755 n=1 Tax=Mercenaria mercenaria TaxID=6596 RepID=UPI00234E9BD8|nr:uncharacterized protein LOC123553755 [Mercenaria mercenaria]